MTRRSAHAASLAAILFGVFAFCATASAHAFLESAVPAAGAIVISPPAEIVLHFTESLEPAFSSVKVTDDSGKSIATAAPQFDGKVARVAIGKLTAGLYRVTWRAVSVDTHQTQGNYTFRVAMASKESVAPLDVQPHEADLSVLQPWLRATPPGAATAGGYLRILNNGKTDDTLEGGVSPAAAKVELHATTTTNGVMQMRDVPNGVVIAAGTSLTMAPGGGYHLMFVNPKMPFKVGDRIPATLHFAKAGDVTVVFTVEAMGAMAPSADTGSPSMSGMKMH